MAKMSKTTETETMIVVATLIRDVHDKTAYMDGHNLTSGRELYQSYEVKITSKKTGKTSWAHATEIKNLIYKVDRSPNGAYARIGNAYTSQPVYDLIVGMLTDLDAELGKSDEQVALETEEAERKQIGLENLKRKEAEMTERAKNPGWCSRCQDWTYGDCGHN